MRIYQADTFGESDEDPDQWQINDDGAADGLAVEQVIFCYNI